MNTPQSYPLSCCGQSNRTDSLKVWPQKLAANLSAPVKIGLLWQQFSFWRRLSKIERTPSSKTAKYQWLRLLTGITSTCSALSCFFFKTLCICVSLFCRVLVAKQEFKIRKRLPESRRNCFSSISKQMLMTSSLSHSPKCSPPSALKVSFWTDSKPVLLISRCPLALFFQQSRIWVYSSSVKQAQSAFSPEYLVERNSVTSFQYSRPIYIESRVLSRLDG